MSYKLKLYKKFAICYYNTIAYFHTKFMTLNTEGKLLTYYD